MLTDIIMNLSKLFCIAGGINYPLCKAEEEQAGYRTCGLGRKAGNKVRRILPRYWRDLITMSACKQTGKN